MVLRFVATAIGHQVSRELASSLVRNAAIGLRNRYPHMTPRLLDGAIWSYQRTLKAEPRVSVTKATADACGDAVSAKIAKLERELDEVAPTPAPTASLPTAGELENGGIGRIPFVHWPEIARIVDEVGKRLQVQRGDVALSTTEIKRAIDRAIAGSAHRATLPKPDWTLPTDFCYNRINAGPGVFEYHVFRWINSGFVKYLGHDCKYTGSVMWKPDGLDEVRVGEWDNGVCTLHYDPREHRPEARAQFVKDVRRLGLQVALQKRNH